MGLHTERKTLRYCYETILLIKFCFWYVRQLFRMCYEFVRNSNEKVRYVYEFLRFSFSVDFFSDQPSQPIDEPSPCDDTLSKCFHQNIDL